MTFAGAKSTVTTGSAISTGSSRCDGSSVKKKPAMSQKKQGAADLYLLPTEVLTLHADARSVPLPSACVDLVVTSPPYWRKRDYGFHEQIGQEDTPAQFVEHMIEALTEWGRLLTSSGSVFLNIGDSYWNRTLAGIPGRIESAAIDRGWAVRNRIIWAKESGMPDPAKNRLAGRHEYILHLTKARKNDYYYDIVGYSEKFGNGANPGDVWNIPLVRNMGRHLAPYPEEIVERAIYLACPDAVCTVCGFARRRIIERTAILDPNRPQARRAMELAKQHGLTKAHIAAIQAHGISDTGKAMRVQNGTGRNSDGVKRLAAEAKAVLGGYFREFTFAKKATIGWTKCDCGASFRPGIVFDPFMGTGTTLRVAQRLGRSAIGVDLAPKSDGHVWGDD